MADLKNAAGNPSAKDSGSSDAASNDAADTCATCGGRGTVPCTACTDGKAAVECDACLGTGSPSAAFGAEWQEHMDAGKEAGDSLDLRAAEKEWRAALSIAETFGEHDPRLMKTLLYLGVLLRGPLLKQKAEGEAMFKRGQEIGEYLRLNGLPEEKKCAKCKGTGKTACPDCKGRRVVPCPDCRGKRAGGGEPSSAVCSACGGAKGFKCTACETGQVTTDCPKCHGRCRITCEQCKGKGFERCDCGGKNLNCPNCHGAGEVRCDKCQGSGRQECVKCNGTGRISGQCTVCKGKRWVPCKDCHGTGVEQTAATVAEEKAAGLLSVAQAFETNKQPDLAVQRYQELLAKYPDTEAAATAKKRLEELQARDPGK